MLQKQQAAKKPENGVLADDEAIKAVAKNGKEVLAKLEPVDEIGQILLAAANYLESHGWCQHRLYSQDNMACAVGAIRMVTKGEGKENLARMRLARVAGCQWQTIPKWNDQKGRTAKQVIDAFRKAAHLKPKKRLGHA
jgi:hypothetical protein